ncbi:hypothetical protein BGZ83_006836 [Gryganskiella cystojenkinii]|nr:hypothetical protein BGZ83_006836 [Gryganskiella cystojenkinii]
MARQRSHSASSIGSLAKSPSSLLTSLSASVALHDSHQPKTLQDILLLAQSHYISHRYVPALALYKVAAEQHNSIPACSSLFALYTSTLNVPGLVKSDTKATLVLMHALRIWMARRWPSSDYMEGSARSKVRREEGELDEYFAHSRPRANRPQRRSTSSGNSIPIRSCQGSATDRNKKTMAQSMESEYRAPRDLLGRTFYSEHEQDNLLRSPSSKAGAVLEVESHVAWKTVNSNCEEETEYLEDAEEEEEEEEEEEDEEAKEEEARRIGLATEEIDDIVQKLCRMIQKGVLGLQEPVLVEAVSLLRRMEKGLKKEAEARNKTLEKSRSLFASPDANNHDNANGSLLLTQALDLSFLDLDESETAQVHPLSTLPEEALCNLHPLSSPLPSTSSISNAAIQRLSGGTRAQDLIWCRAIRIRLMFTLGWVHQQKGEYHYGGQAYGVCSEIEPTGKRVLDMLQRQAAVQKCSCHDSEKVAPLASGARTAVDTKGNEISLTHARDQSRMSPKTVRAPIDSSSSSTNRNLDISSPSSFSGSESGGDTRSSRATVNTFLSLSEAVWSSGLFKMSILDLGELVRIRSKNQTNLKPSRATEANHTARCPI